MREFEFISPMGGTLIWVPGDTVQGNLTGLSDEAHDRLKSDLAPVFSKFTMILSGTMVADETDRSNLLNAYGEFFGLFVGIAQLAIRDNELDGDSDDPDAG